MRFLFATSGNAGHILPLVPFAQACVRGGHEVRVAGPHSSRAMVEGAGLAFRPFDAPPEEEVAALLRGAQDLSRAEADALMGGQLYGRLKPRAALPGMLAEVEAWRPDAIVREGYELASSLVAELHGIPHVRVATGLASTEDRVLSLTAGGLPNLPVDRIRASPYLTMTPPALDDRAVGHRFRSNSAATAAQALPDWWPGLDGPLVYVTFGSMAGGMPVFPALYRAAVRELADLPVRVLLTIGNAGDPAELGPLPANVHVERWVPQADVLPHAAAMVCHGGYGTTSGALAYGVPLVVVPMFADQPSNALRVAEIGAGIALPAPASLRAVVEHGTEVLAGLDEHVRRLLAEPRYARAARRVAESARALPPVDATADVLAAIAGEGVSARGAEGASRAAA
jgi:UDP:flavonoid glycosyltransferase YjiC (YdhE family)